MPFISAGDGDLKSAFITDVNLIDRFVGNRLFAWGANGYGQLGDNTTTNRSNPVQTIAGGTNWSSVACGGQGTAAIKIDGTLWIWGLNTNAQLGNNTTTHRSSPVQTIAGGANWSSITCGRYHTAGIKTDGTLWTWGANAFGQLGDNTIAQKSSPVQTIAGGTNWSKVACGGNDTAAIKTDGTMWTWGYNLYGNLGDNTTIYRSSPVQTIAGGTSWSSVACGNNHVAAIKTDGTLWMWGQNSNGQLGDNTRIHRSSPVQTIAGGTNWKQVSCGYQHTAAVKTDGTLWCWGQNYQGLLGDDTRIHRSSPVQTIVGGTNWSKVAGGYYHTAAIKTDGSLWTWGWNLYGQLGCGDIYNRSSPTQTSALGNNWKQVGAGLFSTIAVTYGD